MTTRYVPEYNDHTSLKKSELPAVEDILARSRLLRERGGFCVGEKWVQHKGYVPVYEFDKELTKDEMDILCLIKLD